MILELLSSREISLLTQALPLNINVDNAPFRQQLQALLKTVLARARDASFAALKESTSKRSPKKGKTQKEVLTPEELNARMREQAGCLIPLFSPVRYL